MSPSTFTLNQRRKLQSSQIDEPDPVRRSSQEPSKAVTVPEEVHGDPSMLQLVGQEMVLMETIREADGGKVSTTATPPGAPSTPRTTKDVGSAERELGYHSSSSQVAVWEGAPKTNPLALKPASPALFTPEQLLKAEEAQRRAPMIYGTPERQRRPDFLKLEEKRIALEGGLKIEDEIEEPLRMPPIHYHLPSQDEEAWRTKVEGEVKELSLLLRASHEENQRLRRELQSALEAKTSTSRFSAPQAILDEAAEARAKAKEDAEKKVRREEDAEKKEKSKEVPHGRENEPGREASEKEPSEVTSDSDPKTAEERTMTMVLKLMTGMQDLQRQILQSKTDEQQDEIEYVRYSQELPRLVDWSPETAPIDYNDWLAMPGGVPRFKKQGRGMKAT